MVLVNRYFMSLYELILSSFMSFVDLFDLSEKKDFITVISNIDHSPKKCQTQMNKHGKNFI